MNYGKCVNKCNIKQVSGSVLGIKHKMMSNINLLAHSKLFLERKSLTDNVFGQWESGGGIPFTNC